ncbi:TolC family protein [Sphingobacterium sp. HSC-15S19]|uniref:TolC family protein n=1 Tax=Sphingobacterium TaxID=28453 RepID=UPI003D2500B4
MNRKYNLIAFLLVITMTARAQQVLRITMQEAQKIGLENRFDIKAKEFDIQIAKKKIKGKKQEYLPEINGTGYVHYSPQIQATLIPPGFGGLQEATVLALGAKSTSIFSLELNQPIFKPALATEIQITENNLKAEQAKKLLQETEIKKQISYSYLNVLLRQIQYNIAVEESKRFESYVAIARGKYDNGVLIENDYLRTNLDFENAQQQVRISKQSLEQSMVTLRYDLNIADTVSLELTDELIIHDSGRDIIPAVEAAENRTELRLLQLEQERNQLLETKQKRSLLPTVSFMANYSQQYLNADFNYNYGNGKWWSPYSGLGIQVTVPISAHLTKRNSLQEIKLESEQIQARQEQQKSDAIYEIKHAASNITNALENYAKAKKNYTLAQQIFQNQKAQMNLGSFSYEKVLNTENSVLIAEKNYIQASYEYMTAVLSYDIAIGKL